MKSVPIRPIQFDGKYVCSESAVASVLNYFGKRVTLPELKEMECVDFQTIGNCLPNYGYGKCTFGDIGKSVRSGKPLIASLVPKRNFGILATEGLDRARHSVVIYGYDDDNIYYFDDKREDEKATIESFAEAWKVTDYDCLKFREGI